MNVAVRRFVGIVACALAALGTSGAWAQRVPQSQWFYCARFGPDGKQLLTGGASRKIQLWDVSTGREVLSLDHPGWLHTVAFSPDGKRALSGTRNRTMRLWDLVDGKMLREFNHGGWVTTVLFLPDGKRSISLGGGERDKGEAAARVWDLETGRELRKLSLPPAADGTTGGVNDGSLSADGKLLAVAGPDTVIWDLETGDVVKTFPGHRPFTWVVALSPDGGTVVTGGTDERVRVTRVKDGTVIKTLPQGTKEIRSLAISPDGDLFVVGVLQGTFTVYRLRTGARVKTVKAHDFIVSSLDFSPDGKFLVSGAFDGTVKVWDMKTGRTVRTLR